VNAPHQDARTGRDRACFDDPAVAAAAAFIADTGLADGLAARIYRPLGRPRMCTVEGLLVGMTLCARRHGAIWFSEVADILHWGIPEHWRRRFHLKERRDDMHGFEAGYRVVLRLFHTILVEMDPSPLPKNKRLPDKEKVRLLEAADQGLIKDRRERLQWATGQVLEASIANIRPLLAEIWDGSVGVDATPIRTWARGLKHQGPVTSTDPDAGWYTREGDHRDPDVPAEAQPATTSRQRTNKGHPRKGRLPKIIFGYDAAFAVLRNPHHTFQPDADGCGDSKAPPALILGMTLDRPGHNPGPNGVAVLHNIQQRGHPAGELGADNLYNSCREDKWQLPIRAMGYQPTYDYRANQRGIQATAHGANMVEGTWYCPSMPAHLVTATQDLHAAKSSPNKIDKQTWVDRIAARAPYALPAKGRPDAEGHQRYQCPHHRGKVFCPLKEKLLKNNDPRLPMIDPQPTPAGPPRICCQTSITIAPEDGAKHWQPRAYGTAEWQKVYFRLRNAVEGINGYAKDDAREAIERAGRRRIRGIAAQTLLLAFQLAQVNLRKIRSWLDTLPGKDGQPRRRAPRRTSKPLSHWTPQGYIDDLP
jgi:hypothetical protein